MGRDRKVVSIHQPHYLPYHGYFDKIDQSDVFVLYDTVQYERGGRQNRNCVRTKNGSCGLTVPVRAHSLTAVLSAIRVDYSNNWRKKHKKTLIQCYSKAKYFNWGMGGIGWLFDLKIPDLLGINATWLKILMDLLVVDTPVVLASNVPCRKFAKCKTAVDRLICIVEFFEGTVYLAGPGGYGYMKGELHKFGECGIEVVFQKPAPFQHRQVYNGFVPNLSILDMLFNVGPDTMQMIRENRQ